MESVDEENNILTPRICPENSSRDDTFVEEPWGGPKAPAASAVADSLNDLQNLPMLSLYCMDPNERLIRMRSKCDR